MQFACDGNSYSFHALSGGQTTYLSRQSSPSTPIVLFKRTIRCATPTSHSRSYSLLPGLAWQKPPSHRGWWLSSSIDQFSFEYLERMRPGFRPDGIFLKMCDDGANFTNCRHGHAFTKTAPGHSVQLTGAFPHRNGIINNDWFDPTATKGEKPGRMYCVDDPDQQIVGRDRTTSAARPRICSSIRSATCSSSIDQVRVCSVCR